MSTRAALGFSLLFILLPADPAGAAEKLSVQALGTRLAAKPTGEAAEALAREVRDWFGIGSRVDTRKRSHEKHMLEAERTCTMLHFASHFATQP